ncbi:MAG TPA: urease accessory UreF family protein [Polyangiaceae bacterium]|nr:urease accessory UreF family protein [Polyangiaceae bacterium]
MIRWQLLQIADSAFPTGGFAHSSGLEAAMQHGRARSAEDLDAFVGEHLWSVGTASLPFVAAAFDAPDDVWGLDARVDATLNNHVANRASRTQGRTFLATCARVFDDPRVGAMAARARARGGVASHLAPVFGASLASLGSDRHEALALHLYMALRGVASAAVRLGVVGPHEAQRLQRRHGETLDSVLEECSGLAPDDAATTAPLLDLMAATHDRLYARLFQS